MFNLTPLINQFNQFSQVQSLHQKEMISLLRAINLELQQIKQTLNNYDPKIK
jgi:hypothetical protein